MLWIIVRLHLLAASITDRGRGEEGQTTAEYALVLLGAATIALLIALWAKQGGKVGRLLDAIFDSLVRMVRT
jgi:hypothetical protein